MSHSHHSPRGLHYGDNSPVADLAVAARRVAKPLATVICVHGGLDRAGSFARLARRSESFDVVAYDRRGYQRSRALRPLGIEHHVDDLLALAQCEGARGPVIFFGHSFGGVIALAAAHRAPEAASLVVAYESPLPWVLVREGSHRIPTDDPELEAESFFKRIVSYEAWDRLGETERESRRRDGIALMSDLATLRQAAPFDIAQITTPCFYVHGDGLLAPYYRALCVELARINPAITSYEMANAGHGVHLTSPDQLALLLRELWDKSCASA